MMKKWVLALLVVISANSLGFAKNNGEWRYAVNASSKAVIVKYTGSESEVEIPSALEGHAVTGVGESAFYGCTALKDLTIPSSVTNVGRKAFSGCTRLTNVFIPDGVTDIGDFAFFGCTRLAGLTIPNSVTNIGDSAFSGCAELGKISLSGAIKRIADSAFYECRALKDLTIPSGVTEIAHQAFSGCTALTNASIPDGVTDIGNFAFFHCTNLRGITIPNSVTNIGQSAFSGCWELGTFPLPDSVTSIMESAFYECKALTNLTIPQRVTNIGRQAFSGCTALTNASIPDGVTDIGGFAFFHCTNLRAITIPNSVTNIGESAFSGCSGLTNIGIPAGLTQLADSLFYDCKGLTNMTIPDGVKRVGRQTFSGCTGLTNILIPSSVAEIDNYAFFMCADLTELKIPKGVETIGAFAFSGCAGLTNLSIRTGVQTIGEGAFSKCSSLAVVSIPSGIINISAGLFQDCTSLSSAIIPESVTEIGSQAYSGCTRLAAFSIPAGVQVVGTNAFSDCANLRNLTLSEGQTNVLPTAFPDFTGRLNIREATFDELLSLAITGGFPNVRLNCDKLYRALKKWAGESDPAKKSQGKVCLQELVSSFYENRGAEPLEDYSVIKQKDFIDMLADVVAGGDLESKEIRATVKSRKVVLRVINPLNVTLDSDPSFFRRDNERNFTFEFGKGDNSFSLPISITPLTPDTFQVIGCNRRADEESGLNKFYGLLFGKDAKLLTSQEDGEAVAGCFGKNGEILLVSDSVIKEAEEKYCLAQIRIKSADGKIVARKSFKLPMQTYSGTTWSASPNTDRQAWTVEMWSDYREWAEDGYHRWEAGLNPGFKLRKVEGHFMWADQKQVPKKIAPVDDAFRYTRSTYFHSIDALGRQGFEISSARHGFSPLELKNYERRLSPSLTEDHFSDVYTCTKSLCLPRTSEGSPLRNSWPTCTNFFVGSEGYEPIFGAFLRSRRGGVISNFDLSPGDSCTTRREESATFFYDPSGDLKAWTMGYVAGDAEDGESLLVTRTSGQLLTISPEYKVTDVRTFVTPDGKEAKPLLMLDSHHAGIFLVGKSIVVGTWKPPLLQRLFSRSGKNKSANAGN